LAGDPQKTEQPTPRKLHKARREGQFPSSREFVSAVQLCGFLLLIVHYAPEWFRGGRSLLESLLRASFTVQPSAGNLQQLAWSLAGQFAVPLFVSGSVVAALTLAAQLAVTNLGISAKKLQPDLNRLNPLTRLQQLPGQNFPQFIHAAFLIPLFLGLAWIVARQGLDSFMKLPLANLEQGAAQVALSLKRLLWQAAALILLFGFADLVRQRRKWSQSLRMSKQEIREENKEVDGDPHIKMRIRRMRRDMLRRQMMRQVDTATAVVVNPTHFAVALRYLPESMPAPKVVAKGKNYLALRIRERAIRNQVPIIENPPLAQALYKSAEPGQEIPAHLYRAVAEVLAYVYRLMNPMRPARS
jgi:flagellar biosynthetic protein FlhB